MTHTEALEKALAVLHEIGGAIVTRQVLAKPVANPIIRRELETKAKKDQEIANLALDTWEAIVLGVTPRLDGTALFECSPTPQASEGRES